MEDFPYGQNLKPFVLFDLHSTPDMILTINPETMMYVSSNSNHNFNLRGNDVYQFLGLILISGYHTLPGEKDCWSTKSSMTAAVFPQVIGCTS